MIFSSPPPSAQTRAVALDQRREEVVDCVVQEVTVTPLGVMPFSGSCMCLKDLDDGHLRAIGHAAMNCLVIR